MPQAPLLGSHLHLHATSRSDWRRSPTGVEAGWGYRIRGNHTLQPDTRGLFNVFDVQPDQSYRGYWLFANLQLNLDR